MAGAWVMGLVGWLGMWIGWFRERSWRRQGLGGPRVERVAPPPTVSVQTGGTPLRTHLLAALEAAAGGVAVVDATAVAVTGMAAAVGAVRLRAKRADFTETGASGAARQVITFIQCNTDLASGAGELNDAVWDLVLEAFVTAKVDPPAGHPWTRPPAWRRCQPSGAGTAVGAVASVLTRLGYVRASLPRLAMTRRMLGCGDKEDVTHAPPVFAWRVCEGILRHRPVNAWERAALALVTLGVLAAGRVGAIKSLLVQQVECTASDRTVILRPRQRPKHHHARATERPRKVSQPITLDHWLVARVVVPWIQLLRSWRADGSQRLFPSLVRSGAVRVITANGRVVQDDLWMEPTRPWSARAIAAALALVVGPGERYHGLRSGNNIELRRLPREGKDGVGDVTRRVLHGRSVVDLIGSEVAYHEVFLEDLAVATSSLGGLRIERIAGGLTCTASSASRGERADWVPMARQVIPLADVAEAEEDSSSDDDVVDDTVAFRGVIDCGRCGKHLPVAAHGYMCDIPGCKWGVCLSCHPGGLRGRLRCATHADT
jgi:hypothetical protein